MGSSGGRRFQQALLGDEQARSNLTSTVLEPCYTKYGAWATALASLGRWLDIQDLRTTLQTRWIRICIVTRLPGDFWLNFKAWERLLDLLLLFFVLNNLLKSLLFLLLIIKKNTLLFFFFLFSEKSCFRAMVLNLGCMSGSPNAGPHPDQLNQNSRGDTQVWVFIKCFPSDSNT